VRCTKDACDNHLCEKCRKCSDCCECEVALKVHVTESVREALHPATAAAPEAPLMEAATAEEMMADPDPPVVDEAVLEELIAEELVEEEPPIAEEPAETATDAGSKVLP
jgi:hypothetical protein